MSEYSLDEPGFTPPVPPVPPLSSESSVETPVAGRRKCSSCPRRMSNKSVDRHSICISCGGFVCDINNHCEECLEWSEDDIIKYATYRKSRESSVGRRLLYLHLLCLPPDTLRNPLRIPRRSPLRDPHSAILSSPRWTRLL